MSHSNWNRHAVLGHRWLNHLLQTGESIPRASTADDGAMGFEVSKSSVWRQSFFISGAVSFINQPVMIKNCRDRIYWDRQLFDTGREKEASQINVFTERRLTSFFLSRSLQLHSLIHCGFRQHKHWDPEYVCTLWGGLFCTVDTSQDKLYRKCFQMQARFFFPFRWKMLFLYFTGLRKNKTHLILAQGHTCGTQHLWGNHTE